MPSVEQGEVLVKVRYCGVCGSDLHIFQNIGHVPSGGVMGHEISGLVTEIGSGVEKVRPGDRVTALCGGGYAEYVKMAEDQVIPLPDSVTFEQGALSEPFAVGLRAVRESGLRAGDRAGIVGAGPIGLFTMLAAKLAGALEVYVAEISPARIEAAKRMGADGVFNSKTQDVERDLQSMVGDGVDVAFDCAGAKGTLELSLHMLKKGGTVTVVGLSGLPDEFNPRWLFSKHARIICVPGATEIWPMSVELMGQGRVDPSPAVTDIVSLDDLPRYLDALQDPSSHVQVLVDPWGDRF